MVKAYDLLEKQADDDASEPNYTEKQTGLIRYTLDNPDAEVEDVAEATDSHPNYVRDILTRVDLNILADSDTFEMDAEAEDEDVQEAEEPDEQEDDESEESEDKDDTEMEVEPTQSVEAEYDEMPEEARVGGWEQGEEPQGSITVTIEDEIPFTAKATIPQDLIYRAVRAGTSVAPKPQQAGQPSPYTVELDQELVDTIAEEYDVGLDRARNMVLKVGEKRARELVEEVPEAIEEIMQVA